MKDVDDLIAETSVDRVLNHFGQRLTDTASGEHRMACVFTEDCDKSQYGNLTVKLNDPVNRIYCHSCGVRGNLLTLIHGLEQRKPPNGGRLRGDEFKAAVATLRTIAGSEEQNQSNPDPVLRVKPKADSPTPKPIN